MGLIPLSQTYGWRRFAPLAAGFLVVGVLILIFSAKDQAPNLETFANRDAKPKPARRQPAAESRGQPTSATSQENERLSAVERFLRVESVKVGKPDPDPERTFQRLKSVARGLRRQDIEILKRNALNLALNNDQRFLSVYLLSLHDTSVAAPALLSIALDPLSIQDQSSRLYAEELMIRTQALEGLAKHQPPRGRGPLEEFLARQDNAFLADQARRLLRDRR